LIGFSVMPMCLILPFAFCSGPAPQRAEASGIPHQTAEAKA